MSVTKTLTGDAILYEDFKVDVESSIAKLIQGDWDGSGALSDAIDTASFGYNALADVFVTTMFIEEIEIISPQIEVSLINEMGVQVQNGIVELSTLSLKCWMHRNFGGVDSNPGTLKGYLSEMAEEVKRIIRATQGVDNYSVSDNISTLPSMSLKPDWICRELVIECEYIT